MNGRYLLGFAVLVVAFGSIAAAPPAGGSHTGEGVGGAACTFPYATTDATGTTVRLEAEPDRVVTLNPSAAQTMWEIGAREKVVGVTRYAAYLAGADALANVSGASEIVVVERVVDLEPDLVLAPNATSGETVEQLRELGLPVYHFRAVGSVEDIYRKTRITGRLVGACSGADVSVAWMRGRVDTVRTAVAGRQRPDVIYAFFGYTAGRGTFVHHVIEVAGGNNVAADHGVTGYRQLSPEVVVDADPDWIIRNSRDPAVPAGAPYNATTAVREGQVVVVPIEHLNQPAPRVAFAITTLARHFHPSALASANETATTPTPTEAEPMPTTPAEPSTSSTADPPPSPTVTRGQPGLGAVVALLAVGIAIGIRRDRA